VSGDPAVSEPFFRGDPAVSGDPGVRAFFRRPCGVTATLRCQSVFPGTLGVSGELGSYLVSCVRDRPRGRPPAVAPVRGAPRLGGGRPHVRRAVAPGRWPGARPGSHGARRERPSRSTWSGPPRWLVRPTASTPRSSPIGEAASGPRGAGLPGAPLYPEHQRRSLPGCLALPSRPTSPLGG
jgi:hypothetical protein